MPNAPKYVGLLVNLTSFKSFRRFPLAKYANKKCKYMFGTLTSLLRVSKNNFFSLNKSYASTYANNFGLFQINRQKTKAKPIGMNT